MGGLGNQLFQYATARAVAHAKDCRVMLNVESLDALRTKNGVNTRFYALEPFFLPANLIKSKTTSAKPGIILNKVLRKIRFIIRRLNTNELFYKEVGFGFDSAIFSLEPPLHLSGYWQSWKYFESISLQLQEEIATPRNLSIASSAILFKIESCDAICVHIRRGDYISNSMANQFHGVCDLDYYDSSVEYLAAPLKNPHVFIFSDDPAWVGENFFPKVPYTIVDINSPEQAHQDLWLMASCKHYVIANSSFSWWAAWLSKYDTKKVICPKNWFADFRIDTKDLIPPSWIRR